ncbi:hypothetical protein [Pediococcus pentosaceus]|uniref:hypothetical protein n=1 Tax=Pediococcus pentosaceus TaxID=1255 RepID=UPI0020183D5D|nr:hypothetical protein [Pediococcus pentosaceus]MCL3857919.1 hypothetical protein [Pediococcus pentosaceus]
MNWMKKNWSSVLTITVSIIALCISGLSYYQSTQEKKVYSESFELIAKDSVNREFYLLVGLKDNINNFPKTGRRPMFKLYLDEIQDKKELLSNLVVTDLTAKKLEEYKDLRQDLVDIHAVLNNLDTEYTWNKNMKFEQYENAKDVVDVLASKVYRFNKKYKISKDIHME